MAEKTIIAEDGILRARSPYDEVFTVPTDDAGPYLITLPASGQYIGPELIVELNGQSLIPAEDYTLVGVAPRTQIQYLDLVKAGDKFRFYKVHNP